MKRIWTLFFKYPQIMLKSKSIVKETFMLKLKVSGLKFQVKELVTVKSGGHIAHI